MAEGKRLIHNNRDWSDLPADVVRLIAKKLPDLFDFVHFRVVCKNWRSFVPISDNPPQFPWLIEFSGDTLNPLKSATQLCFYSITSDKTITIPINKHEWFRGASCHYLPCYNSHEDVISLFNPLNKKEFVYPPIRDTPHIMSSPWMVWTGTSPIRDRNILIVDRHNEIFNKSRWAFYDAQHGTWTEKDGIYCSFCYWKGQFLATDFNFKTEVIEISTKQLLYTIPPPEDGYPAMVKMWERWPHLVESSGEIMAVSWFWNWRLKTMNGSKIHVYRLDSGGENGQPCWIRINDIGDRIIFFDVRNGFSMTTIPSTSGFKRGCIYLIHPNRGELYVYDVLADSLKKMSCPFEKCTWFLPSLN